MIPEPLLDRDSLHLLLPALRADLELVLGHPHRPGPPLPLPITALGGSDDPDIARDPIAAWSRHTDRDFTARILAGPHLFYRTDPRATLAAIQHALAAPTRP
jgi:surfactin synthase thioesterase subunit